MASARGRNRPLWALLGVLVLVQICYPLTRGEVRAGLTVTTVVLGYLLSVAHAWRSRGPRAAGALVATATLGGFAVEAVGVATGFPFGTYVYSGQLGPKVLGVPLIIPLAWTWMAWPAWLAALRLARSRPARIALAAAGLAAWDLFLDPQMVAEGYWVWRSPTPALPGVPGIPVGNYLGWLGFALVLMTVLAAVAGPSASRPAPVGLAGESRPEGSRPGESRPGESRPGESRPGESRPGESRPGESRPGSRDAPMMALWLWTYASSVLAHAVFLGLPWSAAWGGILMGAVVLPLAAALRRPA